MKRHFLWPALLAGGVLLGCVLATSPDKSVGAPPADANEHEASMVDDVKEIKAQLKEINTLLHSGTIKVVVILNPDADKR
jgi:hypothetical protein